ncbi:MAG: vWA domain-containing protein [Kofleriaceae bacterium]
MRGISISIFALFTNACGPTPKGHGADDGDDDVDDAGPTGDGNVNTADAPSCGAQQEMIGVVNLGDPPDLLIVLDRSGSMQAPPSTFPPIFTPKWSIMRDGLHTVSLAKDQQIKFGLLEFPSDDNCASDAAAEVPVALGASPAIASYFAGRSPNGNTPAHVALTSALTYYNSIPVNTAGRYVLFATDGLPNCSGGNPDVASDAETVAAVTALKTAGIPTYVLGFGTFGLPAGVLNDAAVAGGKARAGATKFYEANSANDLTMALDAIAGGVIVPSCSYQLASAPPVPDDVTVTVNGVVVPRSTAHTNGWDYFPNAMTITFFGTYCDQITMGAITDVEFVYGCPGPVIN